jgi:ribonuclease E
VDAETPAAETAPAPEEEAAKPRRRSRRKPVAADAVTAVADAGDAGPIVSPLVLATGTDADDDAPAPAAATGSDASATESGEAESDDEAGSPRRGWWQRTFGA